jgi:hypothetical protein
MKMKKSIIVVCLIFLLSIIMTILSSCSSIHEKNISTEYGDEFKIIYDDYLTKCSITQNNSRFSTRIDGGNLDTKIIGIWNTDKLRCYLVRFVIIFRQGDSETFERFDEDLRANPDMVPVVKSILLKNNIIMETYVEYFIRNFPSETIEMLENFRSHKYDTLTEYGLTEDVINDDSLIESMEEVANKYLLNLK